MKTNHVLELKKSARYALVCKMCDKVRVHDKIATDPINFIKLCVAEGWRYRYNKNLNICPDCAGEKHVIT